MEDPTFIEFVKSNHGFDLFKVKDYLKQKEEDRSKLVIDIRDMCRIFILRGNNITSIINKNAAEGRIIATLKQKYGLISGGVKAGSSSSEVNLSRVATSFPHITCSLLVDIDEAKFERPVPLAEMRNYYDGFPRVLMCTITASVIPAEDKTDISKNKAIKSILKSIAIYSMYETLKINPKYSNKYERSSGEKRVKVKSRALKDSDKCVWISYDSSLVNNSQRLALFNSRLFDECFTDRSKYLLSSSVVQAANDYDYLANI